jgi:hypothetical protein
MTTAELDAYAKKVATRKFNRLRQAWGVEPSWRANYNAGYFNGVFAGVFAGYRAARRAKGKGRE